MVADLRAVFGSNDRGLSAGEAFTNRQDQWQAVATALSAHLQRVADPRFNVEDLEAPRLNVLVFYGVGGIGKTTLSRKLEAVLTGSDHRPAQWTQPPWTEGRILPVRIDLARSAGTDFERVVLTIRLALAELGLPLPAFDIALRRYWEANHPSEPLEEYLHRGGLAAKFGKALPEQMQSALGDVAQALLLPGTVGSIVGQVTGVLVRALREHRQSVRALASCDRLADLLEAEPDLEALSYYPHLLAWEIARLPAKKRVTPVFLLDTFEDTGDRTRRDLERLLQHVVWLMPNCFFVITGRSRLQWADEALQGQLDWTGPAAWPALAAHDGPPTRTTPAAPGPDGAGMQILIGDFSPEDCDDYLARRLSRDGHPLIGEDVRHVITGRSHGLPLYLDLSVMRFLEIRRVGRTPQPADFDHDFPALVARTLHDLTSDERHVLRSVSLLDSFDVDLATRAAGLPRQAPAMRLTERPFVSEAPNGLWPFHLHALIRSTIRHADDQTDDRWSAHDWHQAAQRVFTALGQVWRADTGPNRRLLVGCLQQGLALARDYHLELDWLEDAAWSYVSDYIWEPIAPASAREPREATPGTAADALVEALSTLARRQHEHRERTAARLSAIVEANLLPAGLQEMGVYYLAKAQRDLGDRAASRRNMQLVADSDGRLAPDARRGLAHLARIAGDFSTALQMARTLGWEGRGHRVAAGVWWAQGEMVRAAATYETARTEAEQHGNVGERAICQAQRAFVLAFTNPDAAEDEIDLAERLLTGVDMRATGLTVRIAALIRNAGCPDAQVEDRAQLLRTEAQLAGVVAAEAMLELGVAFHYAVRDEPAQITATIDRLRTLAQRGDYPYYADIAHFMADRQLTEPSTVSWLDGAEPTRHRWRTLVIVRRDVAQTHMLGS